MKVNPKSDSNKFNGQYLVIANPSSDSRIKVEFPLTESPLTLKHRDKDIRVGMKGDIPVAMDNFGEPLTFLDAF